MGVKSVRVVLGWVLVSSVLFLCWRAWGLQLRSSVTSPSRSRTPLHSPLYSPLPLHSPGREQRREEAGALSRKPRTSPSQLKIPSDDQQRKGHLGSVGEGVVEREGEQGGKGRGEGRGTASSSRNNFAYVFYITNDVYTCYALANAHRLIHKLHTSADILLIAMSGTPLQDFCIRKCFGDRVKVKIVPTPPDITESKRYKHCYVRFEAFKLYQYKRIIILDADGVAVRNMDHLFHEDLGGHSVAAAYTPNLERWLDSILLVVEPSKELYNSAAMYINKENISKVVEFTNGGAHYDMDIINLIFRRGLQTKLLSKWYVIHDHQFNEGKVKISDIEKTFYAHYTNEKPISIWREKNRFATKGFIESMAGGFLYQMLWPEYDKMCPTLMTNETITLPVIGKDKGYYYPDPKEVIDYLQNNTDYIAKRKKDGISSED